MIYQNNSECLADVTSRDECRHIVEDAVAKFGRVDVLVNNVGSGGAKGTAVEADLEE
jgi:NAD(P)-dependent dehydrogenase (short-subunit alcohol dehydrogenase family)